MRTPRLRGLSPVAAVVLCLAAQSLGQNLSASACAGCHAAESAHQGQTPMGRALLIAGDDTTLKANPKLSVKKGAYTYTVETNGDKSTYSVTDGTRTITLPIRWTF